MLNCALVNAVYGQGSAEQSVEGGNVVLRIATELLGIDELVMLCSASQVADGLSKRCQWYCSLFHISRDPCVHVMQIV